MISDIINNDNRSFFRIAETGQVGYLVEIWEDWMWFYSTVERIKIEDNLLGEVEIKPNQIISMTAKKDEISAQTKESGVFNGNIKQFANYRSGSLTMGPCLVTCDAVIALVRTSRLFPLTIKKIDDQEIPFLIKKKIYWNRSQIKFRLPARETVGFFDETTRDQYIQFTDHTLGWMRIGIPQIKRLTVDLERKGTPVIIETFAGNVYSGICTEKFNLSGTLVSLDKVKKLEIEATDREF